MKKIISFALTLALALLATVESRAQTDFKKNLTGWYYQNGKLWNNSVGDTLGGTTADTVTIGTLSAGGVYPSKVVIAIQLTNTTGDADTVTCYLDRGVAGIYQTDTAPDTLIKAITTTATVVRTLVTDATMTLALAQALANNKNGFDALRLRFVMANVPATARTKFVIRAFGVYPQQ